MSYDLAFTLRPGTSAPAISALKEWLASRPGWRVFDGHATYLNEATGTDCMVYLRERRDDDPADRAPISLTIAGHGPHTLGMEVGEEVQALVRAFDLLVDDPQLDGMGKGEFTTEGFLGGYGAFNRLAHRMAIQVLDQRPRALGREKLEAAWRWNRGRDRLSETTELFVPGVLFAEGAGPHDVETFVAWVEGIPARVPEVDAVQGALGRVAWSELGDALALARKETTPQPHWVFEGEAVTKVKEALERAPKKAPPRLVRPRDVSTAELVAELVDGSDAELDAVEAEEAAGAPARRRQEDAQATFQRAVMAHMGGDQATAYEAAVQAYEADPSIQTACLIAAANALYLAKSAEALVWAGRYLEPSPDDAQGHLLRGVALTDLARYDEAVAALDRSLEGEYDPMHGNCRAYALAAAGRTDEARAEYERALQALDVALAGSPDDADLLARRSYSLSGLGRFEEALASAKRAVEANQGDLLALQDVARAADGLGRHEEAIEFAGRALKVRAVAPEAAFFAARAHAALGQTAEAKAALKQATVTEHLRRKAAADPALAPLLGGSKQAKTKAPAKAAKTKAPAKAAKTKAPAKAAKTKAPAKAAKTKAPAKKKAPAKSAKKPPAKSAKTKAPAKAAKTKAPAKKKAPAKSAKKPPAKSAKTKAPAKAAKTKTPAKSAKKPPAKSAKKPPAKKTRR